MNNIVKLGVLPVAALATITVGTLMSAGSAEAQLTGSTNYDGDGTSIISDDGSITFNGDGLIELTSPTSGDFLNFDAAKIFGIDPIPGVFSPGVKFLDFGSGDTATDSSYDDGKNAFYVTKAFDYVLTDVGNFGTFIGLKLSGFFLDDADEESKGEATLTWQTKTSHSDVYNILNGITEGSIEASFSGLTVASVPEPATMLGLGLVAGAGFLASRRKQAEA